jgi:hypothetical protein
MFIGGLSKRDVVESGTKKLHDSYEGRKSAEIIYWTYAFSRGCVRRCSIKNVRERHRLRGSEKIRSWFDMLTTSGVPQWKFKYLAARPEACRRAAANFFTTSEVK